MKRFACKAPTTVCLMACALAPVAAQRYTAKQDASTKISSPSQPAAPGKEASGLRPRGIERPPEIFEEVVLLRQGKNYDLVKTVARGVMNAAQ